MNKPWYLIDIDHTLLRTEQFQYQARKAVLPDVIPFSQKEYSKNYCWKGSKEIATELAQILSVDVDEFYVDRMKKLDIILAAQKSFDLLPGVDRLFSIIHQKKIPYVLVTGWSRHESMEKIKKSELMSIIKPKTIVVTKDEYTHSKPHPEPYLIGIEKLKKLPWWDHIKQFIAIEDTVSGMISAFKAWCDRVVTIPHIWSKLSFEQYEKEHGIDKKIITIKSLADYRP